MVNSMKSNCPVCLEYLFDSPRCCSVLKCGHTVHKECLDVSSPPPSFPPLSTHKLPVVIVHGGKWLPQGQPLLICLIPACYTLTRQHHTCLLAPQPNCALVRSGHLAKASIGNQQAVCIQHIFHLLASIRSLLPTKLECLMTLLACSNFRKRRTPQ